MPTHVDEAGRDIECLYDAGEYRLAHTRDNDAVGVTHAMMYGKQCRQIIFVSVDIIHEVAKIRTSPISAAEMQRKLPILRHCFEVSRKLAV